MILNTKMIFSMKDANQNFSKVARAIDEIGEVVIYKHNKPRYLIIPYDANLDLSDVSITVTEMAEKKERGE